MRVASTGHWVKMLTIFAFNAAAMFIFYLRSISIEKTRTGSIFIRKFFIVINVKFVSNAGYSKLVIQANLVIYNNNNSQFL